MGKAIDESESDVNVKVIILTGRSVFCAGADIAEMSKISLQEFEYMRKAGVELAQGYLFGKPVPVCEFGRASAPMLTALVA